MRLRSAHRPFLPLMLPHGHLPLLTIRIRHQPQPAGANQGGGGGGGGMACQRHPSAHLETCGLVAANVRPFHTRLCACAQPLVLPPGQVVVVHGGGRWASVLESHAAKTGSLPPRLARTLPRPPLQRQKRQVTKVGRMQMLPPDSAAVRN